MWLISLNYTIISGKLAKKYVQLCVAVCDFEYVAFELVFPPACDWMRLCFEM